VAAARAQSTDEDRCCRSALVHSSFLIHPTSQKVNSLNFASEVFSEILLTYQLAPCCRVTQEDTVWVL
jgi:hypothetical protein